MARSPADRILFITTINLAELWLGIELLPAGKRRQELTHNLEKLLPELFADRILDFDVVAAREFSRLVACTRHKGKTLSWVDAQIAAIAISRNLCVATRDLVPFAAAKFPRSIRGFGSEAVF